MALLAYPLERNTIRQDRVNNAFGMVRNGGKRPHQGWDLVAVPGTPCFAIADGTIRHASYHGHYGLMLLLEFTHFRQTLYAAYCHLSSKFVEVGLKVSRGQMIGRTGNTGNAVGMLGSDQHLHFEIRTMRFPGIGLGGRIDPARLYGAAPIGWTRFEGHGQKVSTAGVWGLKAKGVNVPEDPQ